VFVCHKSCALCKFYCSLFDLCLNKRSGYANFFLSPVLADIRLINLAPLQHLLFYKESPFISLEIPSWQNYLARELASLAN
jgi:hypothetical protein